MLRSIAVVVPVVALTGCALMAPRAPSPQHQAYAAPEPSHQAATPAEWGQNEKKAREAAESATVDQTGEPIRLEETGASVSKVIPVEANTCYAAGIAWSYSRDANVSVMFQSETHTEPVNDHLGGARERLSAPAGTVEFCADHAGEVTVHVSALTEGQGAIATNELLEYALVVGARKETPEQTEARRQSEKQRGQQAVARVEANKADAEARRQRRIAERCQTCSDEYRLCQVKRAQRRKNPSRGVTVTQSCESQHRLCAFGGSHVEAQQAQGEESPCGPPPQ